MENEICKDESKDDNPLKQLASKFKNKKEDALGKNHSLNLNNISFSEQNESLENNLIKGKKILEGLKCKGIPIS